MSRDDGTKLIIPALAPIYRCTEMWAWPLVRATCGLMLLPHGIPKFTNPAFAASVTGTIAKLGFTPPVAWFWFVALLETVGGVMLAVGLLTRLVALMITIEMLVISFAVLLPAGRPYQFTLMWALLAFAIVLRGGGRRSLDSLIGREL
jgi:putative oxidoreductase